MNPIDIASELLGRGEVPDQAMLSEFLENGGQRLNPVETAWCAAFVNAALAQSGQQGTGALNARSFMEWGQPVDQPQRGDVAVFSRGGPNSGLGHVGFYDSTNPDGSFNILGGNQGDQVSLARFAPNALLGFRRGEEVAPPEPPQNALASYAPPPPPQFPEPAPGVLDVAGSYNRGKAAYDFRHG